MPFIVTTRRRMPTDPLAPIGAFQVEGRVAVATLEEAQQACRGEVHPWVRQFGDVGFQTTADKAMLALNALTESGGTVGPLPDGTVIEVEPVAWTKLAEDDKRSAKWAERGLFGAQNRIIAAYNAKQETSCA